MSSGAAHVRFLSMVFCDDIRREASGKDILIGVYPGALATDQFPLTTGISIWIHGELINKDPFSLEFGLFDGASNHMDLPPLNIDPSKNPDDQMFSIAFGKSALTIDAPTTLSLSVRENGGDWIELRTMGVMNKAGLSGNKESIISIGS